MKTLASKFLILFISAGTAFVLSVSVGSALKGHVTRIPYHVTEGQVAGESVHADKLCLEQTCVTEEQLKTLLGGSSDNNAVTEDPQREGEVAGESMENQESQESEVEPEAEPKPQEEAQTSEPDSDASAGAGGLGQTEQPAEAPAGEGN